MVIISLLFHLHNLVLVARKTDLLHAHNKGTYQPVHLHSLISVSSISYYESTVERKFSRIALKDTLVM